MRHYKRFQITSYMLSVGFFGFIGRLPGLIFNSGLKTETNGKMAFKQGIIKINN